MLTSVAIENFRCFPSLKMENLCRINLVVGKNNAGKTSILEAIDFFLDRSPAALTAVADGRNELLMEHHGGGSARLALRNFFHGYHAAVDETFAVRCEMDGARSSVVGSVSPISHSPQPWFPGTTTFLFGSAPKQVQPPSSPFFVVQSNDLFLWQKPIAADWAIDSSAEGIPFVLLKNRRKVTTRSALITPVADVWGEIAAGPAEDSVIEILRIVEPGLTRVAVGGSPVATLFARLEGVNERVPLGSLGDGIQRLLVIASNLVLASGGVLLVDEIDAGLHVSAMEKMWKLLIDAARKFDVQIFATTHSDDCLRGLASVLDSTPLFKEEVCLHRVQRGATESVRYSGEEILQSAVSNVEVR